MFLYHRRKLQAFEGVKKIFFYQFHFNPTMYNMNTCKLSCEILVHFCGYQKIKNKSMVCEVVNELCMSKDIIGPKLYLIQKSVPLIMR